MSHTKFTSEEYIRLQDSIDKLSGLVHQVLFLLEQAVTEVEPEPLEDK